MFKAVTHNTVKVLVVQSCLTLYKACQAPLSMELSRQEYWSGYPFLSPGDLPDPETEPRSPTLQVDSLPSEPPGMPSSEVKVIQSLASKRPQAKECRWPLKAGKGKEMGFPLEPPERATLSSTLILA